MKILVFSSRYLPEIGGVQNVVSDLVNEFKNAKDTVEVISAININDFVKSKLKKFILGFFYFKKIEYLVGTKNYKVYLSIPRGFFGFLSFFVRFPFSILYLRHIIKRKKYDIINAHFLDDSLVYFYFATLFKRMPIILNIHGNEIHKFSSSGFYKYFYKKILNKSKAIIVNSFYMKSELIKKYPKIKINKIKIISNGIDISESFKTINKNTKSYFLFVGRLDKKKGIEILLKAFANVSNSIKKELYIVGGSSGEKKHGSLLVQELQSKYKQFPKIHFLGRIPRNEVIKKMRNAYFTVFPSINEPFGIVAIESMYCATPFIASSGGFVEIAKMTNAGIIFKTNNIKALSSVLLRVDKDIELREKLSTNCIKNIKMFNIKEVAKEYSEIFNKYAKNINSK